MLFLGKTNPELAHKIAVARIEWLEAKEAVCDAWKKLGTPEHDALMDAADAARERYQELLQSAK